MRKIALKLMVALISILNMAMIPLSASENEKISTLNSIEVEEALTDGTLPDEYILESRERCYYQCTYYRYTTLSKDSRSYNVFLRDHPSWKSWLYDNTIRTFCTDRTSSSISTSLSIGGSSFTVGVGYAPSSSGTYDCVTSTNKAGKTKVRPTIRGDKYILRQKVEKVDSQTGKVLSSSTKSRGVTENEQLGLRYA